MEGKNVFLCDVYTTHKIADKNEQGVLIPSQNSAHSEGFCSSLCTICKLP